jgi:hypothetical protein
VARVVNKFLAPGINADKIANGSVSNTEFQYLDGVTSNIQTQLNSKLGVDVVSIGVNTSAVNGKTYLVTTTGITVTLPAAALNNFVTIKDAAGTANNTPITIAGGGGNIDGAASITIDSNYGSVTLVSNGTNWFRL